MSVKTAVVLAGGEGLRLRPITNDRPKAMVKVGGKPIIDWILHWLSKNGIDNVVIGVAYRKDKIINYLGNGERYKIKIQYSNHTVDGGTAQGFRLAIERFIDEDVFIAMNGDEITNINLQDMAKHHITKRAAATIAISPLRIPLGVVRMQGDNIINFEEKPVIDSLLVSIGVYVFQRQILDYLPETGNIEKETFPKLAVEEKLKAYRHNGLWVTVNTLKDLNEAAKKIKEVGI